jgi:hypothetical protein
MAYKLKVDLPAYERGWGNHKYTVPAVSGTVEFEFGQAALQKLAEKAARNKTGRAIAGPVVARLMKRKK